MRDMRQLSGSKAQPRGNGISLLDPELFCIKSLASIDNYSLICVNFLLQLLLMKEKPIIPHVYTHVYGAEKLVAEILREGSVAVRTLFKPNSRPTC